MPYIEASSYQAPFLIQNAHLQTILPSYFMKEVDVEYQREKMDTPDGDYLYLDWARCQTPTKELLILSHGLCGHTHRHYILSLVHAFRRTHIDCLAWNYRMCGRVDNQSLRITTNNSTDELGWVIDHAIQCGYEHIYLAGFSMGGNLSMLYLGREAKHIPPQVHGGFALCVPIDTTQCVHLFGSTLGGIYERHFVRKLCAIIRHKHEEFPELSIENLDQIQKLSEFDERYTAPLMGFRDAEDYYRTSSAVPWLSQISLPTLLVNPTNDPFLTKECYPVEVAKESKYLFLEMPAAGGHCGFLTHRGEEWWPAVRAREFIQENVRKPLGLPPLLV